ncbi:MAG TPA: nuclear transport factor 2 family protein [Paludibacter sp.]|nr:nuclear transport factor 2 family protein [Paludibacter sp.]
MKTLLKRPSPNSEQSINDKFSVKELIEFERFCRDNAQWDEMKKCFADDSRVTISWFQGTGKEFVDTSSKMNTYAPHKIFNTIVWLKNEKAVSITMATIQTRGTINGHELELNSDAKLIYRTQKIDGEWQIISMDGIYEKDALVPVSPNAEICIPKEEIAKFRSSYAHLTYMLNKGGYTINSNLPGIDKPELVDELYEAADQWLNQ